MGAEEASAQAPAKRASIAAPSSALSSEHSRKIPEESITLDFCNRQADAAVSVSSWLRQLQAGLEGWPDGFNVDSRGQNSSAPVDVFQTKRFGKRSRGRRSPHASSVLPSGLVGPSAYAASMSPHSLTLLVETDSGVYMRDVADARPLAEGVEQGPAAEHATGSAVARWGLPDFVFRSVTRPVASGIREVGDLIVIHGSRGFVIQVKSRNKPSDNPDREVAWLKKAIGTAARQAAGTVRHLRSVATVLSNLRGRTLEIDTPSLQWFGLVVIDHPGVPEGFVPDLVGASVPTLALLRRDWEFLFEQLYSTGAVVDYIARVLEDEVRPLGAEPHRYYELALADAAAPPQPIDPRIIGPGESQSVPLLPTAPIGTTETRGHLVMRMILEDIAEIPTSDTFDEAARHMVLAALDTLPVGMRGELGLELLRRLEDVANVPEGIKWRIRRIRYPGRVPHFTFATCTEFDANVMEGFKQLVWLRHHEFGVDRESMEDLLTVGVMLTPRNDGVRGWDTTLVACQGDLGLSDEHLADIRRLWRDAADAAMPDVQGLP